MILPGPGLGLVSSTVSLMVIGPSAGASGRAGTPVFSYFVEINGHGNGSHEKPGRQDISFE